MITDKFNQELSNIIYTAEKRKQLTGARRV